MLSTRPSPNPPDSSFWWMAPYRPEEILKKSFSRQPVPKKRKMASSFLAWSVGMLPRTMALERRAKLDWEVREHEGWHYWKYHERKPRYYWLSKGPKKSMLSATAAEEDEEDDDEEEGNGDGGSSCSGSSSCCASCISNWYPPCGIEWAQQGMPEMQADDGIQWSFPPMQEASTRGRRRRMESPVRTDWSNQYVSREGREGLAAIYSNRPAMRVWV